MNRPFRRERRLGYREHQMLGLLRRYVDRDGRGPSYTAIGNELGMQRHHVADAVRRMERRGLLKRVGSGCGRCIVWVAELAS